MAEAADLPGGSEEAMLLQIWRNKQRIEALADTRRQLMSIYDRRARPKRARAGLAPMI